MKKLILLTTLVLTGCAIFFPIKYTGESLGDDILKSDTERMVKPWFKAVTGGCSIDEINTQVTYVKRNEANTKILLWTELWTAKGCNKVHKFKITYRPDSKGETDCGVTMLPD